jgi:hypothetical protein
MGRNPPIKYLQMFCKIHGIESVLLEPPAKLVLIMQPRSPRCEFQVAILKIEGLGQFGIIILFLDIKWF